MKYCSAGTNIHTQSWVKILQYFIFLQLLGRVWILTLDHRRDPWAFLLPASFLSPVCVCILFPHFSSFSSALPLPVCWLPVEQQLPPSLPPFPPSLLFLPFCCSPCCSLCPLLSPSSLFFNPTLPEPVRMSSGLLCKRHGRGTALVLGCHTPDQPP